ncbi:NUDIX domain-containing protein [Desertihabitans aurantiacus]|uniref:NUDIX domain-containing protein n=1 Tax=Desertihabitans aurantiacus TaxID=2282477 RepID=UPI000DF7AFAC|nr:NUDIX domain-containing protein [Desertihabitans aurantiacus]
MSADLNPAERLLLLVDELRGAGTAARRFAGDAHERERAEHLLDIAARLAALTEIADADALVAGFVDEAWMRMSPMVGISALVRDDDGRVLLCRRSDDASWCLPGGLLEVGESPTRGALRELWEEAGLTGEVTRLLGVFDGPTWGTRSSVHQVIMTFEVNASRGEVPVPGVEMSAAEYFAVEALPEPMHRGHDRRISVLVELARTGGTHHDPASTIGQDASTLPMFQRPL